MQVVPITAFILIVSCQPAQIDNLLDQGLLFGNVLIFCLLAVTLIHKLLVRLAHLTQQVGRGAPLELIHELLILLAVYVLLGVLCIENRVYLVRYQTSLIGAIAILR